MSDGFILQFDRALRTLAGVGSSARPYPAARLPNNVLAEDERRHAAALMRVNHTGEVCAQALYQGQAITVRVPALRLQFEQAAKEEEDHLAWTQKRLEELNDRTSLLNPLWYLGSLLIGAASGLARDRANLGFVVETERQVEEHLTDHMDRLPVSDARSRAIVSQMRADEVRHGAIARQAGAADLPLPMRWMMRATAKVMTVTAYRI